MLQQTFFLLLNVSFPPCFLSPLLLPLLFFFFFFWGGGGAGSAPPESAPVVYSTLTVFWTPDSAEVRYNVKNTETNEAQVIIASF